MRNAKEGPAKKGKNLSSCVDTFGGEQERSDAASKSSSILPSRLQRGSLELKAAGNELSSRHPQQDHIQSSAHPTPGTTAPSAKSRNYFTGWEVQRVYSKFSLTFKLPEEFKVLVQDSSPPKPKAQPWAMLMSPVTAWAQLPKTK